MGYVIGYALSYSRDHRLFTLPLDFEQNDLITHEYVHFDPLLDSFNDLLRGICSHRVCKNKNALYLQLKHQYEQQLNQKIDKQLLSRRSIDRSAGWLSQSDALTQLHYDKNTMQLQTSLGNLFRMKDFQSIQEHLLEHLGYRFPAEAVTLTTTHDGSLVQIASVDEFLAIARLLFSKENYFLCLEFCELFYQFYFEQSDISYSDLRSLLLFSQMMVLSSALFGDLELSTLMYLKFLEIYRLYEVVPLEHRHFESSIEGILAVHQLRLLLLLPPLPRGDHFSSFSSSLVRYRQEMEEDLELFIHDLLRRNITVSLQDLSVDSSSTPFHLSHQGLNDKKIQILLSSAYTTLCPSLNYLAPRLRQLPSSSTTAAGGGAGITPRTLRIGFISSHFFDHSIGRMFSELFLMLSQIVILDEPIRGEEIYFDFKVFFIDQTLEYDDDNGNGEGWRSPRSKRIDSITGRLYEALGKERFVFLPDDISVIREVVGSSEYNLDVLIYADIGMELTSYLLAHSRLAPYQVSPLPLSPLSLALPLTHSPSPHSFVLSAPFLLLFSLSDRLVGSPNHLWLAFY
jgi:hypothetical protein